MEKTIVVEPLQKRFVVGVKDAHKAARNRSFANASDCCGVQLRQDKFCSGCNAKVEVTPRRKLVKIGKEVHLIDAAALQEVKQQLEQMEDVRITKVMRRYPEGASDRFAGLAYVLPAKKREAAYKELVEVMKGFIGIGSGVFRGNEFQVLFEVGDDGVARLRKLVDESQRYPFNPEEITAGIGAAQVNEEIVEIERKLVERALVDAHNLAEFRDSRVEFEEKVIEEFVLHGRVPEATGATAMKDAQDADELERLKALMGGGV